MLLRAVTDMALQAIAGKPWRKPANQCIPSLLGKNTGRSNRWGNEHARHRPRAETPALLQ